MRKLNHSDLANTEVHEPLYCQLAGILRKELQGLSPGRRFYGDHELCRKYTVSLPVVRGAMAALVREGRIRRVRRLGTFVAARKPAGRCARIAVVTPLSAFFPHTAAIQAMQQIIAPRSANLILAEHPSGPLTPELIIKVVRSQLANANGIVWVSAFREDMPPGLSALGEFAERIVFINIRPRDRTLSCVCADYEGAAFALTEHLIGKGYKKIGYIGGPAGRLAADLRRAGFEKALLAHGLRVDPGYVRAQTGGMNVQTGQSEIRKMLSAGHRPEAIFTVTDHMARGVIMGLGEEGLHVPDDVAVVGFDDDPIALAVTPTLTTARIPYYDLGKKAVQLLFHQLDGTLAPGVTYQVECPVIVRESSGGGPSAVK